MIAILAAALLSSQTCSPPPGVEALWTPDHRFIVVGEIHGTTETPAAFAQLICAATRQGSVTVALELPTEMQPQLDAFMGASDSASAEAILHDTFFWQSDPERQDGRSSVAMLDMMQSVRRLKAEGRDVTIRAFQPSSPRPATFDQNYYELDMAVELAHAAAERPESRVLVLVGNIHASKTRFDRFDLLPAAAHLPRKATLTLNVAQQGGASWSCQSDGCGPHDVMTRYDAEARGVIMEPVSDGAYDGVIAIGTWTPSPPVAASNP